MKMLYTNSNQQVAWINDETNYALINISGIQPPKATIQCGTLYHMDGSMFLHSRIEQRNIVLTLQILQETQLNRQRLTQIFKPKQKGSLKIILLEKTVMIDAYCESIEVSPMSWPVRAIISLLCPQPYFEDIQTTHLEMASITHRLMFPLDIPSTGIRLGTIAPATAINAYNPGDIELGFTIRFQCVAIVENPKLINLQTGEYIQLQVEMQPGEIIEIHTEAGQKRIEQIHANQRINLFHTLKLGSIFLQLKEKDNVLYATSDVNPSALMTEIFYRPKYSGI